MNPITQLAQKWDIDRAVALGILTRCWQIPAGVVTMVLVAIFFTPDTQGVYYTVLGILGLQLMAEAGLQSVILHAASHEWAQLSLASDGRLEGSTTALHRIASLAQLATKWFAVCAVVFALAALAWGFALFASRSPTMVILPLVLAVTCSAFSLVVGGLVAILEGCDQVRTVNWIRLLQAISGSVVVWIVIAAGGALWAIPISFATQLGWECFLVLGCYRPMMQQLRQTTRSELDWRTEVWPLQWKMGLQGFVRQFAFVPILPILFAWHGSVVAGQAGMTMTVLNNLLAAAFSWIRTRAPRLGELIASGEYAERDRLFFRTTARSTAFLMIAVCSFCGLIFLLGESGNETANKFAARFLPMSNIALFALAVIPQHLVQCFAIYIRAHKQDPLWKITITGNAILAVLAAFTGIYLGAAGIGASILFVFSVITLPCALWIWRQFYREYSYA